MKRVSTFGTRLKELRRGKGLSQAALAEETGKPSSSIAFWELRKNVPSIENVIDFAEYFGVTVGYMAGVEED